MLALTVGNKLAPDIHYFLIKLISPTVYVILCLRFSYVIASIPARLDMNCWLVIIQQGLSPCKKRQASLGAHSSLFNIVRQ